MKRSILSYHGTIISAYKYNTFALQFYDYMHSFTSNYVLRKEMKRKLRQNCISISTRTIKICLAEVEPKLSQFSSFWKYAEK